MDTIHLPILYFSQFQILHFLQQQKKLVPSIANKKKKIKQNNTNVEKFNKKIKSQ